MDISNQEMNFEKNDDLHEKFFCDKCDYSTNLKSSWTIHCKTKKHQHNMTHEELYKRVEYYCECCDVKVNHMNNWEKHVNSLKHIRAGKPKSIECIECNRKFINHQTQKHHMLSAHSTKEERAKEKYYCETCDYVFISKLYWDKHNGGKIHQSKVKSLEQLIQK
jgi:hypothetical protein